MATFTTNTLTWNTTLDRWLLSMSQIATATDNLGIPTFPYVKKCYVSLEAIRKHFPISDLEQGTATVSGAQLSSYLRNNSEFVRISEQSDLKLPTSTSLGNELATKVTKNWYGDAATDIEGGTSTFLSDFLDGATVVEDSVTSITADGYLEDKDTYILRTDPTEHLSLEGWFYFRDESLINEKFYTYDEAKKIKDTIEYRLEWMTKTETTSTYLPLSAGVSSISPARKGNLPNSSSVSGICAGDTLRVSVGGGSGEYSITIPSEFTEVGFNSYRFVENTAGTFSLVVEDTNVNTSVTLSIQTEEKA